LYLHHKHNTEIRRKHREQQRLIARAVVLVIQPHQKNFVLKILNAVNFTERCELDSQTLWSTNKLQNEIFQRQSTRAKLLNGNDTHLDTDELFNITGNSALMPIGNMNDNNLRAVNWSINQGGMINVSNISYKDWTTQWIFHCEMNGDTMRLTVNPTTEQSFFGDWLHTQVIDNNKLGKLCIGSNSGQRSWCLSLFYTIIGQPLLFEYLLLNQHFPGSRLLYKLLIYLKLSVQEQRYKSLLVVTQFLEAILLGHYYWWFQSASVEAAFELFGVMSENLLQKFAVKYDVWCPCPIHIYSNRKKFTAVRLSFNTPVKWDAENGNFMIHHQSSKRCFEQDLEHNHLCQNRITKRIFHINNAANHLFILYFKHGIPKNLWQRLLEGEFVKVGNYVRQVINAIFVIDDDDLPFICGYLLNNPTPNANNPKKWVKFDTKSSLIMNFVRVDYKTCKFVFFGPAPMNRILCNICNKVFQSDCYLGHSCL